MEAAEPVERVLARWRADEARVRSRIAGVGVAAPAQAASLSGIEFFDAIFEGRLPAPPIGATLDFLPIEIVPGRALFQGAPGTGHYNPLGSVHGGWIATLLDSAVACAVHTLLPAGKTYTTLELKVNYVKALTERVPLVRAIGEIIYSGGRIGTSQGRLVGPDGTLFAHATTTCIVLDAR